MFAVKTFDGVKASGHQLGNDFVGLVECRVSHRRNPVRLVNQFDCFQRRHFMFGNPPRPILFQETVERFIHAGAETLLDERASHVRAAGRPAIGESEDGFTLELNPQRVEARDHFVDALLPDLLKLGEFTEQHRIVGINEQAKQVHFVAAVLGCEFGARNEFDVTRKAGLSGFAATFHGIVIGQSDRAQALLPGMSREFGRRVGAVREAGVEMEISKHGLIHFTSRAGRINSPFTLSRMPFTNLPLSSVENFLAISTASLMLTTGGMSSRNSIS